MCPSTNAIIISIRAILEIAEKQEFNVYALRTISLYLWIQYLLIFPDLYDVLFRGRLHISAILPASH